MFGDLKFRLMAKGGWVLTLSTAGRNSAVLAQMLESGYCSPKTGYWLETRIWLGFDAAGNSTLKGMHKST